MAHFEFTNIKKRQTIKLSQIKVNAENPRTITGDKFQKLVNSILVFPKMLGVRPIVINKQYKALGGNMRTNALNYISKLTIQQIEERLAGLADYQRMTDGEKRVLTKYMQWLWNNPQSGQSPYKLFEGALTPHGKDGDGNLIYTYSGVQF